MAETATIDGPHVAPASGKAATSLVIFTHGYGSNGEDLIGLAPYWQESLPDTAFIAPNAPQPCPGSPGGYQWWALGASDRKAGVNSAAPVLDAFIDAELARHGLTEDRLALVGFSQGTMMALHVGPRRAKRLAGVVGFSGILLDDAADEIRTRPPVLLIHGDADPMVPVSAFHSAEQSLRRLGFNLATHVSPGLGHSIDGSGLKLAEVFLTAALA
jgi:phospholipase/carboxylesterase